MAANSSAEKPQAAAPAFRFDTTNIEWKDFLTE